MVLPANRTTVNLHRLTRQLDGWVDYGQPEGSMLPTREPGRFFRFTHWKLGVSGSPRTETTAQVERVFVPRTSWQPHPLLSIVSGQRGVKKRSGNRCMKDTKNDYKPKLRTLYIYVRHSLWNPPLTHSHVRPPYRH